MHRLKRIVSASNQGIAHCVTCGARQQSVCGAVEEPDLDRLATIATEHHVGKGQTFIEQGQPATEFFNITAGTAKLFKLLPDGRQQIIGFAGVGHFLGLAVSQDYAFSAEAIEPLQLCRFSRAKLRGLLDDLPMLEQRLLQTACDELVTAQEQMLLLGRKTAPERVASFLIAQDHGATSCHDPVDRIALPMTRAEIADYLGLTIETISRMLSRFKADKRIATPSSHAIVILDRAWLEALAAGLN